MTPPLVKQILDSFFLIDSILIEDKNRNGLFDPQTDKIEDIKGRSLRPDSQEVKKVLSQIGVKSLNGLRLSSARTFINSIKDAEYFSKAGDPEEVEGSLSRIRTSSGDLKVSFSKVREEKILKQAYSKGAAQAIEHAKTLAGEGDLEGTCLWLERALRYSSKLQRDYGVKADFEEVAATKIFLGACHQAMERSFRQATMIEGDLDPVPVVDELLKHAKLYASFAEIPFDSERAKNLRRLALLKGFQFRMDAAEEDVLQGRNPAPDLSVASQYAQEGVFELDTKRFSLFFQYASLDQEIRLTRSDWEVSGDFGTFGHLNQIMKAQVLLGTYIRSLNALRKAVAGGEMEKVGDLFENAGAVALDLKESYQIEVDAYEWLGIFDSTVATRLERDFNNAQALADSGHVEGTQNFLEELRDHTIEWGVEFDEVRSESILANAYDKRLENSYKFAEFAASSGDKEAREKFLKEAEGYSKELGLSFDQKRADEIRKRADHSPRPRLVLVAPGFNQPLTPPSTLPQGSAKNTLRNP